MNEVLKAGLAHLWFVTLHPFDDGNGRIARALADMMLARSEKTFQRFYSMSAQIQKERAAYYDMLAETQKGTMDITHWMIWFLDCLGRAIEGAQAILGSVLVKARVWEKLHGVALNERQTLILNRLLERLFGAREHHIREGACNAAVAVIEGVERDLDALIGQGILIRSGGGRSTSYGLKSGFVGLGDK